MSQTPSGRLTAPGRSRPQGGTPWTRADVIKAAAVVAVGCLVWAIGWHRVAYQPAFAAQIAPMNVSIVGFVIVCAGQMLWFLGGRRAISDRRRVLLGSDATATPSGSAEQGEDRFAGSERFYHRLDCAMVGDRAWTPTPRAAQERAGRVPCGVCAP